jgi:hypothetical protein
MVDRRGGVGGARPEQGPMIAKPTIITAPPTRTKIRKSSTIFASCCVSSALEGHAASRHGLSSSSVPAVIEPCPRACCHTCQCWQQAPPAVRAGSPLAPAVWPAEAASPASLSSIRAARNATGALERPSRLRSAPEKLSISRLRAPEAVLGTPRRAASGPGTPAGLQSGIGKRSDVGRGDEGGC